MSNPIAFFEITCRDSARLVTFYREMFGWTIEVHSDQKYATVSTGATGGTGATDGAVGRSGIISELPDSVPAALTVFVRVESLDGALARAATLGGQVLFPPMQLPTGQTVAMITDP